MIGIIGAMEEEITFLLDMMTEKKETTVANSLFIEGKLAGKNVVLLKSGIGKVNAAMSTTIMHERYQPSFVINTGSAGGFAEDLNVGDIVISDRVVHHDVDVTAFNYEYGHVPGMPANFEANEWLINQAILAMESITVQHRVGMIASGDTFMESQDKVKSVRETFPETIAVEMEAASVAQVCFHYSIPFVIVRALSDIAGKESSVSFDEFLEQAAKNTSQLLVEMIKIM